MFYSQVILAKKGPLAKVWLAAHWGDKKLARPQIFATDIAQSVDTIVNPTMPLALRMSGHLLLGVVRIYSRKVKYVLNDCTEAMLKLQMAFHPGGGVGGKQGKELLDTAAAGSTGNATVANFGDYDQVHVVEGFCLPLPDNNEWILAEDDEEEEGTGTAGGLRGGVLSLPVSMQQAAQQSPEQRYQPPQEETWVPFDPENEDEDDEEQVNLNGSQVSDVELARAAGDSFLSGDEVCSY
jgi:cohesin complex subunit SCC1